MSDIIISLADLDDDVNECPRCGNSLPVDRHCDCAGTELDPTLPKNRLSFRRLKVYAKYGGLRRTYPAKEIKPC